MSPYTPGRAQAARSSRVGAIFLDKDGTLVEDVPYNVDPEQMRFAPGAREGLQALARCGLPLIVVSNQSGIALGRFDEVALDAVHLRLAEMFDDAGADLADFYYCPHHPDGTVRKYAVACDCRKPASGLFEQVARERRVALDQSWMIGDILHDIEAGRRVGCQTILIDNGNETEWQLTPERTPHFRCPDFAAAARVVCEQLALAQASGPTTQGSGT
ncbi:D-glycero-alpha-D-manno-heptose-1,7-bisphosphate 7-phosphatase [Pigmentiphaga litoralis]|uniref:D,D-heptose 1,7-bisphosphate phosphatase n=1 Tax=Pigmentiphaga litoralis TaxID=516702 RepID=A0A7Y9IWD8_9BURK|nr:HAD family hydrolase [Pigmentiphaga litoralis]NYE22360.1 histidinol-phosphate phosphatase family protein [Pigmentiphaga litoralis]NYE84025.1 histidinol-phosphate phosphatase family protein [Pigmentiphaga litoralis]